MLMSAFSDLVNTERVARGWSYNELADAAGLEKSGVSRLLSDDRPPTIKSVVALGRCFGAQNGNVDEWIVRLVLVADKQRMAVRALTHGRVEALGLSDDATDFLRTWVGAKVRDVVSLAEVEARTVLTGGYFDLVRDALAVAGLTFGMRADAGVESEPEPEGAQAAAG